MRRRRATRDRSPVILPGGRQQCATNAKLEILHSAKLEEFHDLWYTPQQ